MKVKRSLPERVFDAGNALILILLCVVTLYPLYYVLIVSLSSGMAVARGEVKLVPLHFTLSPYRMMIRDTYFVRSILNTLQYTVVGTTVNLSMSALCAYPLSIRRFSGNKVFTRLIVFTMFFSGGLIPTYLVVKSFGLLDSVWAIALPTAISSWNMFIIRTYFQGIPQSLRESAQMDGANDIFIFLRIILPLSLPVMATMTLFYATGHWNSFFPELIYLSDKRKYPMQLILRNMLISSQMSEQYSDILQDSDVVPTTLKYAAVMISTVPILLVYPFLQRYFAKGVMI
ncbi:MAG: sugar ABC transporter permease, partial [Spirochaetes bacterium RBG_13_68_11]